MGGAARRNMFVWTTSFNKKKCHIDGSVTCGERVLCCVCKPAVMTKITTESCERCFREPQAAGRNDSFSGGCCDSSYWAHEFLTAPAVYLWVWVCPRVCDLYNVYVRVALLECVCVCVCVCVCLKCGWAELLFLGMVINPSVRGNLAPLLL